MSLQPYNVTINIWAFQFAKNIASDGLTNFMLVLSASFFLVIIFLIVYMYYKRDANFYSLVTAMVLLYLISDIIKLILKEPRPCNIQNISWINNVNCDASYSFPSSHASVLTGLPIFLNRYRVIDALYILWLILVLFGRIYLGLHYLTDVIAGAILSILISYLIYNYRRSINAFGAKLLHNIKRASR